MLKMFSRKELFYKTMSMWPDSINLHVDDRDGKGGKRQQLLNEIYDRIESSLGQTDELTLLSSWAFHQAISSTAVGVDVFFCAEKVPYELYEQKMFENLRGDDCWKFELDIYFKLQTD